MTFSKFRIAALFLLAFLFVPLSGFAQEQAKVVGHWKQYAWDGQRWKNLGIFVVYSQAGNYLMAPASQKRDTNVINTKGLFDVKFSETAWQFKSDWGNGDIAEFELERIGSGAYHGWAYLEGKKVNENLWVLIK
ncbi:MAG: hypothetical protein PHQ60_15600 [Sideroxydans sp.]|nr:hypothetical protein [Sideroxydans sp.]